MKPITKEEIQAILDSGVTKNFIEKKLKMGQGSIGKFLTGKLNSLPDKYAAGIRKIGKDIVETNEKLIAASSEVLNVLEGHPLSEFEKEFFCDPNAFNPENVIMAVPSKCSVEYTSEIKRPKINKDLFP